jgi:hypothetical protein
MHATSSKGDIGVARATADLIGRGFEVLLPVNSTSPFDLAIYRDGQFVRVQVKYIAAIRGVLTVAISRKSIWQGRVKKRSNDEADIVCVFNPDTDKCYYVAVSDAPCSLRITPPKNNYQTGVRWARDYVALPTLR